MVRARGRGTAVRIALTTVVALSLVVLCVVAYFLLDTNRLKGPLARLVRAQTGRAFAVSGDLSLQLGRQLRLSAAGAELANADWATDPAMVSVDRLGVTVDLASLLDGPVLIERLAIEGARVRLERAADGTGNWQIFGDDGEEGSSFDLEEGLPVVLRQLNLDDCLVTYAAQTHSSPLRLEIVSLDQAADADGFLELRGEGALEDRPIRIEGGIGPFAALTAGRNFRHELEIDIGETRLRSRGSVGDLSLLEDVEILFEMREP